MLAALRALLAADELAAESQEWEWENLDHVIKLARGAVAEATREHGPITPEASPPPGGKAALAEAEPPRTTQAVIPDSSHRAQYQQRDDAKGIDR